MLVILASVVLPVDRFRVSGGVPIAPVYSAYNAIYSVDSQQIMMDISNYIIQVFLRFHWTCLLCHAQAETLVPYPVRLCQFQTLRIRELPAAE